MLNVILLLLAVSGWRGGEGRGGEGREGEKEEREGNCNMHDTLHNIIYGGL